MGSVYQEHKTIIARLDSQSTENICVLSQLLVDYPHPELSVHLAQKLFSINAEEHLPLLGKLLNNCLSDYLTVQSMISGGYLKKENWIEKVLEDMMLYPRSSVTAIAFECIQKPLIGLVIPQKKLVNLESRFFYPI